MMKPLPTSSQAYSFLLQEESQRASPMKSIVDSMAMNVKVAGKPKQFIQYSNKKSTESVEVCDYCHNTGYSQNKCFFLHSYLDWHHLYGKPKPKLRPKKAAPVTTRISSKSADVVENSGSDTAANIFSDAQCEK